MPTNFLAEAVSLADANAAVAFLIPRDQLVDAVVSTLAFSIIGILLFALAFWAIVKISPFSIRKEIEEDQNMALALVIAAVIIGIALVVSAAVHG
jgi:uncharacterized membrane protein YjfL (UPF0719 family)